MKLDRVMIHGAGFGLSMLVRVSKIVRSLLFLVCVGMMLVSCGGPVGGDSKSPVFLTVEGDTNYGVVPLDVYDLDTSDHVTDDTFWVNIKSHYKGEGGNASIITDYAMVQIYEYRVTYYRVDGNPRVPDPFTIDCSVLVPAAGSSRMELLILKREAKLQSPLKDLILGGGEGSIELQTIIEFFGKDLIGNHVSAKYVAYFKVEDVIQ
jgi:hypothetical protein